MMESSKGKSDSNKILKAVLHNKWRDLSHYFPNRQSTMNNLEIARFGSKTKETKISGDNLRDNLRIANKPLTNILN